VNASVRVPTWADAESATISLVPLVDAAAATVHRPDVVVVKYASEQSTPPMEAPSKELVTPKLRPTTVLTEPPAVGPFGNRTSLSTGASYVNILLLVPIRSLTWTRTDSATAAPSAGTHVAEVLETHFDFVHETCTATSGFRSDVPKLRPETVTVAPDDEATFADVTPVTTGAS
jgi:hypothetical protein